MARSTWPDTSSFVRVRSRADAGIWTVTATRSLRDRTVHRRSERRRQVRPRHELPRLRQASVEREQLVGIALRREFNEVSTARPNRGAFALHLDVYVTESAVATRIGRLIAEHVIG